VAGQKHSWQNEIRAKNLEMGRLSNLAKRCQDGKVMALLAQTTLKRDSSFATGKTKRVPEKAPGLGEIVALRKMALDSLRKNSIQKPRFLVQNLLGKFYD